LVGAETPHGESLEIFAIVVAFDRGAAPTKRRSTRIAATTTRFIRISPLSQPGEETGDSLLHLKDSGALSAQFIK
jgi:hypothetical protein